MRLKPYSQWLKSTTLRNLISSKSTIIVLFIPNTITGVPIYQAEIIFGRDKVEWAWLWQVYQDFWLVLAGACRERINSRRERLLRSWRGMAPITALTSHFSNAYILWRGLLPPQLLPYIDLKNIYIYLLPMSRV